VFIPPVSPHAGARLLTVAEVAELLRVSRATVYKLCEAGDLAHVRVSNSIRVAAESLQLSPTQPEQ
jgi:excisionase family DNA binding protein